LGVQYTSRRIHLLFLQLSMNTIQVLMRAFTRHSIAYKLFFYWARMRGPYSVLYIYIYIYIYICQCHKTKTTQPNGLLQHLHIPEAIWTNISMERQPYLWWSIGYQNTDISHHLATLIQLLLWHKLYLIIFSSCMEFPRR